MLCISVHSIHLVSFVWGNAHRMAARMCLQGSPVAAIEMTEADAEEVRLRRIQENNRRNQRKFRARQRVR